MKPSQTGAASHGDGYTIGTISRIAPGEHARSSRTAPSGNALPDRPAGTPARGDRGSRRPAPRFRRSPARSSRTPRHSRCSGRQRLGQADVVPVVERVLVVHLEDRSTAARSTSARNTISARVVPERRFAAATPDRARRRTECSRSTRSACATTRTARSGPACRPRTARLREVRASRTRQPASHCRADAKAEGRRSKRARHVCILPVL